MADTSELETAISEIDREIEVAEKRLAKLRLERLGADAILTRLNRGSRPSAVSGASAGASAGNKSVVETILAEIPEGLNLSDIAERAASRGVSLSGEQIRSAVTYLKRRGKAESPRRGHWRLIAPTDTEATVLAVASVSESSSEGDSLEKGEADESGPASRYHGADPADTGLHRGDGRGAASIVEVAP